MRVPLRWLKEYVEINVTTEELADRLTMAGLEVAAIEQYPSGPVDWEGIVVGEVVGVEAHPNADKLVVATVKLPNGQHRSVTGAPNITIGSSGMRVAVATEGALIINAYNDESETITVKATELRGVESQVVLCSECELGLSDDHSGVLFLDDDAAIGSPLVDLLGDEVIDIDLTPNLGRCLSIIGVAREVAVLTGGKLSIPQPQWSPTGPPIEGKVKVEIKDPELCPRYSVALIENVKTKPAPFWMRYRLMLAGMRPISNIVDITNYVMLEWGQPLHAFDYDSLSKRVNGGTPKIIIRTAHADEKLTTLDNVERNLATDMLMIADTEGSVALAGVMGGLETEVEDHTSHILLESASFHPINNRRTATRLNLPSEASHRFSRGVPTAHTEFAAKRAAQLMHDLAEGTVCSGLVDDYPKPPNDVIVRLPINEVDRILGIEVPVQRVCEILERLDFTTTVESEEFVVQVPYYRLDVEIPADVVEEVARVLGYDKLPATLMKDTLPSQERNIALETEEQIRDLLCGMGLTEVVNYSLTHPESVAKLNPKGNYDLGDYIELANPISRERSHMRKTLLNLLLENVEANQRHQSHIAIYEIGRVFLPSDQNDYGLPNEPSRLGIALAGNTHEPMWAEETRTVDFYDLKGIIDLLLESLEISGVEYSNTEAPQYHPGRSATVSLKGIPIGTLGEVHPAVAENFDLSGRIYLAELDLEAIIERANPEKSYVPLPRYPGIRQDLAVLLDEAHSASQVEGVINAHGAPLLQSVDLFDVYTGEQVPAGKKSLAYSLLYRAEDRTLTDEEVQEVHQAIQSALEGELNAQIRGIDA